MEDKGRRKDAVPFSIRYSQFGIQYTRAKRDPG